MSQETHTIINMLSHMSNRLTQIENKVNKMSATIDDILKAVEQERTLEASLITLVNGLQQQLHDALAGVTLPPAVQAKLDAALQNINANSTALSTAIAANTPVAPQS